MQMKGPEVPIDKPKFDPKVEKIGTDITQKGKSDIYANVDKESGVVGTPQSFRTDLPPADQMFDEGGNLKPEIRAEADKASTLSNQPSQIRSAAKAAALGARGPSEASITSPDPQPSGNPYKEKY